MLKKCPSRIDKTWHRRDRTNVGFTICYGCRINRRRSRDRRGGEEIRSLKRRHAPISERPFALSLAFIHPPGTSHSGPCWTGHGAERRHLHLPGEGAESGEARQRPIRVPFVGGQSDRIRSEEGSTKRAKYRRIPTVPADSAARFEGWSARRGAWCRWRGDHRQRWKGRRCRGAMGGLAGGFRRIDERRRQAAQQQVNAQSSQQNQQMAYNRAMAACLEGRGYTVK
jgi:hypothetical protein